MTTKKRKLVKQSRRRAGGMVRGESPRQGSRMASDETPSPATRRVPVKQSFKSAAMNHARDVADKPFTLPDGSTTTMRQMFPGLYTHPVDAGSVLGEKAQRFSAALVAAAERCQERPETLDALLQETPCGCCRFVPSESCKGLGSPRSGGPYPHEWWCPWYDVNGVVPF